VVEVRIEGRRLDVFEGFDFSFNYGVADIRNPEKRSTEYSKTIKCPATKSNDELFGHIYDVNISNDYDANISNISVNFNPNKKAEARVISDGVEVMAGVVQLRKIVQKGHAYTYEVVFIGKLLNIFSILGDKELSAVDDNNITLLDLSQYDHELKLQNQVDSWTAPIGDGYVYPMIHWGNGDNFTSAGKRIFRVDELRPAVYVKSLVDAIFQFAGFTYTSSFFDLDEYKRLIIPLVKQELPEGQAEARKFKSVKSLTQILSRFQSISPNSFGNEQLINPNTGNCDKVCFEDDNNLGFDNNDQYLILSQESPFVPYNYNAAGNYVFVNQTNALRNDTFRTSVTLELTVNQAVSTSNFEGRVDIARKLFTDLSETIIASGSFNFDLSQVGVTQSQTVFVEGDSFTELNDEVFIKINTDPNGNGYKADYRNSATGIGNVKVDIRITGGFFENEPIKDRIYEGDTVELSRHLPDVEMREFLTSIFKMFNLYVEIDPNNERNLLIETRDTFYSEGGTKDWTYKIARDKNITIEPLGLITDREYIYTYSEDGDYYNERYQNNRGHAYGRARIEVDNDFVQSSKEVEVVFSPSPLVNDGVSNRIIPAIWDADIEEGAMPTDANIRIMYYGGLLQSNPSWKHRKHPFNDFDTTVYPYAGHWDNPITPTIDINFGLPLELYYQTNGFTGQIQVTNANLYNLYHRNYINEVTDKDSKVMTAMFYLEPTDINKLDFRDQIVIDNSYWRLNKVMNYNPFKEGLTKVELIKIKEPVTFQKSEKSLNAGGYLGKERMPSPSSELKTNGNKYPAFQGKVSGADNNIGQSVTAFKVVGSRNSIGEGSKNITIFGNDNQIAGGLHNVQLINTNGIIVTDSNVTYINGKEQDNVEVLDGGLNEVRALNGGTNIFTVDGGEDIVQTQFSEIAIYIIEGGEQ